MIDLEGTLAFARELGKVDCKPTTVQHPIDGLMYTSSKLPARQGLDLWARLTSLLGPALLRAIATSETEGLDPRALVIVAERAMRDGLGTLVESILSRVQCNKLAHTEESGHVVPRLDDHFAGEYLHLLKVCAFAVAHNLRGPTYGAR